MRFLGKQLIPFYIFSHENSFPEYNSNEQKLAELKAEYQVILERLDELERQRVIGAFDKQTIIDLSGDVIEEIAEDSGLSLEEVEQLTGLQTV